MEEDEAEKRGAKSFKGVIWITALVVAGLGAAVTLFILRAQSVGAVDEDAFISFSYARNLLAGNGLTLNPDGQRVEGITNLLWTLLLAAGSWMTGSELPAVSVTLGLACGVLILLLSWAWGFEELVGSGVSSTVAAGGALAAPALLAMAPGFAYYAATGLEVASFALLITAGLYLLRVGGRLWCAGVGSLLLGAAAMTRPEGAMVLAFAAAAYAFWPGKDTWRRILTAALPGGALIVGTTLWRLYYYGALVPNTAFAKSGGFEAMERWGWPYVVEVAGQSWFHIAWLLVVAGAIAQRGLLKRNLAVIFLVPCWAAYIVYVGGDYMPFGRFVQPMLPVLYTLAVVGVGLILRASVGPSRGLPFVFRATAVTLPVIIAVVFFVSQVPDQVREEAKHGDYLLSMREQRRAAANWMDENVPGALVARNGVGAFGYYSDVRVLDMLGLNDRYIARHGQQYSSFLPGHQTSDADYILRREPDYIMLGNVKPPHGFASEKELAESPEFHEEYDRVLIDPDNGYEIHVWKRLEDA